MPRKRTSERTVPRSLMVKVFGCRLTQAVRLDWGRRTETFTMLTVPWIGTGFR